MRRHTPFLRAYIVRIVGSLTEADDVAQESLLVAWRQLPALRDHPAVRAWLVRIATRRALTAVKKRPVYDVLAETADTSRRGDPGFPVDAEADTGAEPG